MNRKNRNAKKQVTALCKVKTRIKAGISLNQMIDEAKKK